LYALSSTVFYTLSLHDALPISLGGARQRRRHLRQAVAPLHGRPDRLHSATGSATPRPSRDDRRRAARSYGPTRRVPLRCALSAPDRKSTRLNASHVKISYAVFC